LIETNMPRLIQVEMTSFTDTFIIDAQVIGRNKFRDAERLGCFLLLQHFFFMRFRDGLSFFLPVFCSGEFF